MSATTTTRASPRLKRSSTAVTTPRRAPAKVAGWFVYVLGCLGAPRPLTYVGWTTDPARRLAQHNAGTGARTTRGRAWVLLHVEPQASMRAAMSREWHLKRDRALRRKLLQAATAAT